MQIKNAGKAADEKEDQFFGDRGIVLKAGAVKCSKEAALYGVEEADHQQCANADNDTGGEIGFACWDRATKRSDIGGNRLGSEEKQSHLGGGEINCR